jgi:hypothetical protein
MSQCHSHLLPVCHTVRRLPCFPRPFGDNRAGPYLAMYNSLRSRFCQEENEAR